VKVRHLWEDVVKSRSGQVVLGSGLLVPGSGRVQKGRTSTVLTVEVE
jgi:hypothetical protein